MIYRIIAVLMASLLVAACLITPGTFTSELVIDKKGRFDFVYQGEITVLGFGQMIDMAAKAEAEDFAGTCYDDDYQKRDCTEEEIAEQRAQMVQKNASEAEMYKAMLGDIDPTSPESIDQFVTRISRQKGWNRISHKGDGIFDVDFSISGHTDQGFTFPMIEKVRGLTPFVTIIARKDDKVRIEAPGFSSGDQNSGMGPLTLLGTFTAAQSSDDGPPMPAALPNGTFTVRTTGDILTNNTEEGPTRENGQSVLRWEINTATKQIPETLIALD